MIDVAEIGFLLREHDLRGNGSVLSSVEALVEAEGRSAFDLEHGPLVRSRLIVLGDEDHVLLVTMHHIVSDGWSAWGDGARAWGSVRGFCARGG